MARKPRASKAPPDQTISELLSDPAPEPYTGQRSMPTLPDDDAEEPPIDPTRDIHVDVEGGPDDAVPMAADGLASEQPLPDGGMLVDLAPQPDGIDDLPFDGNLAEVLSDMELQQIAADLIEGVQQDDDSRKDWLEDGAKAIKLLGVKLEDPRTGVSSAPMEGMSVFRHPLLLEAVLRFHANAMAELLPSGGPCKIENTGMGSVETDEQANVLEDMINFYMTNVMTEYYTDTDRMLFMCGLRGAGIKKIYRDPIKRRPVSMSVEAEDLIVNQTATDIHNASRVTHRIRMRKSTMRRMQLAKVYLDIELGRSPDSDLDPVKAEEARVQGIKQTGIREEDQDYELYEIYCELDLPGYEHKEPTGEVDEFTGEPITEATGLPLPYKVVLEKESQQILEIRRNWKENDPDHKRQIPFVIFPYWPGLGFWPLGLCHMLGNLAAAVTASSRMMMDNGMFSNFPGFIIDESFAKQTDNNFRISPGEGKKVKGAVGNGMKLTDGIMPLPFKDISGNFLQFTAALVETGQRLGQTADMQVGEGTANAPVGTTMALLDAQTKVLSAVHKRLHAAQKEELAKILDLIKEDPEVLWMRYNKAIAYYDIPKILQALQNVSLIPCSDPNTPSKMHRMAKVQGQIQLSQVAGQAGLPINTKELYLWASEEIGTHDAERFIMQIPPGAGPPNPMQAKIMDAQNKAAQTQLDAQRMMLEFQDRDKERASKENLEIMKLAGTLAVHPEAVQPVNAEIDALQTDMRPNSPSAQQPIGSPPAIPPPMPSGGPMPSAMPPGPPMPPQGKPQLPPEVIRRIASQLPPNGFRH